VDLIVDASNVMGSRPDGWWRDRPAALRRLHRRLVLLAATGAAVTLVLDRPDLSEGSTNGMTVVWPHRSGRDAADDRIVDLVGAASDPAALEVVTADRALRTRVEALGARTSGPRVLHMRLDQLSAQAPLAAPRSADLTDGQAGSTAAS